MNIALRPPVSAIKEEMGPSFFANWRLIFFAVSEDPVKATPEMWSNEISFEPIEPSP